MHRLETMSCPRSNISSRLTYRSSVASKDSCNCCNYPEESTRNKVPYNIQSKPKCNKPIAPIYKEQKCEENMPTKQKCHAKSAKSGCNCCRESLTEFWYMIPHSHGYFPNTMENRNCRKSGKQNWFTKLFRRQDINVPCHCMQYTAPKCKVKKVEDNCDHSESDEDDCEEEEECCDEPEYTQSDEECEERIPVRVTKPCPPKPRRCYPDPNGYTEHNPRTSRSQPNCERYSRRASRPPTDVSDDSLESGFQIYKCQALSGTNQKSTLGKNIRTIYVSK